VQLVVFEALTITSGVALGGMGSMQWAYSFLLVMFAAVQLPFWGAMAFGLVTALGVVAVAQLSGVPMADQVGAVSLACITLLTFTYFVSTVTQGLRRIQASTEAEHRVLQAEVDDLSATLTKVAAGDLTAAEGARRIAAEAADAEAANAALGEVWGSLGTSLSSVRTLVAQAEEAGRALGAAVIELDSQVAQSSAGYTQQSAAIAETSATMRELAGTAEEIAGTVDSVNAAAERVRERGDQARDVVAQAVGQLQQIVGDVEGIATQAEALDESSLEIDRIVNVIDELADRTNLLALNAAIEAARAGEHGRGFAVVASEVRGLAERSGQSAAQIKRIVERIRSGTRATVVATSAGREAAHRGVELVEGVRLTLDDMVAAAHDAAEAVAQIRTATEQQTKASRQVAQAMAQVSEVADQQAAGTRSSAEAVRGLSGLADQLSASLTTFRT
jgi:methyl-accepting chemotaxis protein